MNTLTRIEKSMSSVQMKKILFGITIFTLSSAVPILISGTGASAAVLSKLTSTSRVVEAVKPEEKILSYAESIYERAGLSNYGLDLTIFDLALKGFDRLSAKGLLNNDSILTVVDFSKSSRQKRLFVIDLKKQHMVYNSLVAHGKNSGTEYANSFSNAPSSHKSSLGFFITRGTYQGSNGYSLQIDGCEKGINDKAFSRAIVMHAAAYANENVAQNGFLGRSFGCPAVPEKMNKKIIDKIKGGNVMFLYFPDNQYLKKSQILNG
jgi:hypothetical protein